MSKRHDFEKRDEDLQQHKQPTANGMASQIENRTLRSQQLSTSIWKGRTNIEHVNVEKAIKQSHTFCSDAKDLQDKEKN